MRPALPSSELMRGQIAKKGGGRENRPEPNRSNFQADPCIVNWPKPDYRSRRSALGKESGEGRKNGLSIPPTNAEKNNAFRTAKPGVSRYHHWETERA